ncbi:NAD-dependent epimerase/dehydratase [Ectocarpus siliculosus]|uniref:NAD-dependent epimerase/dehydratase n=1 Tax=Ectocarpus siliculosus TaxID=2880 RepID=D7FZ49_ECTSI|nr:NAD-dependent epimerase/dehydratase [Ectocarpus siliculosus]|eukprot:CBJ32666.1 NAD-dependent epimerase/dehydratase [Ectocarpus siliculosus]
MQKFVLSGGLGLLGQRILQHIVSSGHGCVRVMIVDTAPLQAAKSGGPPTAAPGITGDPAVGNGAKCEVLGSSTARGAAAPIADDSSTGAVSVVRGDLSSSDVAAAIKSFAVGDDGGGDHAETTSSSTLSVFHLASVMSGQGEEDFGEALRVNIDGTRSLLDTCRQIGGRPRFVFASSIAAFGGGEQVTDETKLLPQSTYGMTKACAELLVNDCTRKGFVDGRIARLPTVVVRPGPPNPAATGCFSSVPKAVLHGQHFISPVSPDLRHACVGLCSAVDGLIRLHDASEADFGPRDRAITLPAVSLSLRDLEESAARLARELGRPPGTVSYEPDSAVEAVVKAMPSAVKASNRTANLGLLESAGAHEIVEDYVKGERLR